MELCELRALDSEQLCVITLHISHREQQLSVTLLLTPSLHSPPPTPNNLQDLVLREEEEVGWVGWMGLARGGGGLPTPKSLQPGRKEGGKGETKAFTGLTLICNMDS